MVNMAIIRRGRLTGTFRRTRSHFAAAFAAVLAVSLAACGSGGSGAASSQLDKLKESGTVRIGVSDVLPITAAEMTPTGYQAEMAEKVFHELGIKNVTAVPVDFGALIPSLQSKRIDAVVAGLYVTVERCKAVTYATPSVYFMDGLAVPKGNPNSIRSYEDVAKAGTDLGFLTGSAVSQLATVAGVDKSKLHDYADLPTMLDALKAGRIAAAAETNVTIAYAVSKPAYSDLTTTDPIMPIINGSPQPYASSVAFAKDAGDLVDAFSKKQTEMFEAGAFDELIKKWSIPKESVRPATAPTVDQICGG